MDDLWSCIREKLYFMSRNLCKVEFPSEYFLCHMISTQFATQIWSIKPPNKFNKFPQKVQFHWHVCNFVELLSFNVKWILKFEPRAQKELQVKKNKIKIYIQHFEFLTPKKLQLNATIMAKMIEKTMAREEIKQIN